MDHNPQCEGPHEGDAYELDGYLYYHNEDDNLWHRGESICNRDDDDFYIEDDD